MLLPFRFYKKIPLFLSMYKGSLVLA